MDQKTEISRYIKCRIRLKVDSKQIFTELCGMYGPQTISLRTVLGGLKTPMYCQENNKFEKDVIRNFL